MEPHDQSQPPSKPASAPAVPKELLSARPAMTRVVPRSPDKVAQPSQSIKPAQPTAEELAERQERIDYLKSLRQKEANPKKGGKKWLLAFLIVLVLAALAGAGYWFLNKPATPDASKSQAAPTSNQSAAPTTPTDETADFKDYQSTNFALSLKYPKDWTVSDTAPKLTITSPQQSLTSPSGSKLNGAVVVTIRPKQTALDEFKTGNAAAVLASKRVAYTQPAAGQRDSTYLSYLQYAKTTSKGALDAVYVTGNAGYQKGQYVPQADVIKVDPLITVTFVECSGTCAASAPATNVEASSWAASSLGSTVETILKSLAISA